MLLRAEPHLGLAVALLCVGAALASGCRGTQTEAHSEAQAGPGDARLDYRASLAAVDRQLRDARDLAAQRQGWADHELVAQLHLRRARLSGAIEDWKAADQALDAAFERAPAGGGPLLTRLELDLSLHRLDRAAAGIAQVEAAPLRTSAMSIRLATARGELAAQRGELDAARRAYERARELGADPAATAGRLALLARRQGQHEAALASFAEARSGASTARGTAWLLLQAGLVEWERGQPTAALASYEAAEASFPGWWLVTEHRAEALAALGRDAEAEALYRQVIEETGHPEFMSALGELLASQGREAEAKTLIDAAGAEHDRRLAILPEAARGHAPDGLPPVIPR
ncbi:Beta-barrel assembly-enhancing protease [Enhygromyxa salina]|uniref:Beta-barrel assembly-enhancing protease n=1 Tax=Enhygromyxa salina TaxID=215803 RepID=A0A2S9YB98_9BACT|nr:tetratricopeptide repeat protein [Enhygromyxa salina]PRQ02397.1 Beta-barrel assembly-enhancing protease [Enhygromyxa salina]